MDVVGRLLLEERMGIPIINQAECTGCEECVEECPAEALVMMDDVAFVNAGDCTECGECAEVCPAEAILAT